MEGLGPLGPDCATQPILIAVSGGADSMALAFLARQWRQHVIALVVDHALRTESAEEAQVTCQRLADLGIASRLLTLGPLAAGGLQEQARVARFDILEAASVKAGGSILLVGHHQADQDETLWMRHERGSGQRGLCGIARKIVRGRITVMRPLLTIHPQRLRATLLEAGVNWCEDPSNQNRRFQRVRVRQDLEPFQRREMRVLRQQAVQAQMVEEEQLAWLMSSYVEWQPEGWVKLLPGFFGEVEREAFLLGGEEGRGVKRVSDLPKKIRIELLGRLVRLVGGHEYLPTRSALEALFEAAGGSLGRTCLVPLHGKQAGWRLYRESRAFSPAVPAYHGVRWDGRWRYLGEDASYAKIAALGDYARHIRVGRSVAACVLPSLPALWVEGRVVAVPEGVRGVKEDITRCALVWDAGEPAVGGRLY